MNILVTIINDLIGTGGLLVIILSGLVFLLGIFSLSDFKEKIKSDDNRIQKYLLSLIGLLIITIFYWSVDSHITDLPDPVVPYIFGILLITISFGVELGSLTGFISFILLDYFLFEPRYTLYDSKNFISVVTSVIGLVVALLVGTIIHRYHQRLIKEKIGLETLIKAKDRFAAAAVHDLKNPITTIKLYTQLIENKKVSVETINRESDKLLLLVDQLLDYTKIQNNKFIINKEKFDLKELCQEKIKIIRMTYPEYKFDFCVTKKEADIWADKNAIDRVITNLLNNAVKYSPKERVIKLKLNKTKKNYIITIKDKGQGISKENQKLIFEPFSQLENSQQGLGMGLYIVKSIIELHQGKITLKSKEGEGAIFRISLPFIETKQA